jgi:chemotaxis response regulator CheB
MGIHMPNVNAGEAARILEDRGIPVAVVYHVAPDGSKASITLVDLAAKIVLADGHGSGVDSKAFRRAAITEIAASTKAATRTNRARPSAVFVAAPL